MMFWEIVIHYGMVCSEWFDYVLNPSLLPGSVPKNAYNS